MVDDHKNAVEHIEARPDTNATAKMDKANQLLQDAGHSVVLTPENNKRVLRQIDMHVLPLILGIYFLQALDKATLAYASVFGLVKDTHLVGKQYSWLGSIVYLAQLVAQPVITYFLVKFPLGKFLGTTTLCWGITLSCMAATHNFGGLLGTRFLLGAFESGVAPAFIAVTQMWWRRREQPVRLASWYAMNGITNMLGSLITYGLGHIMSPHLKSYQIIFLFFGVITVAYSSLVYLFMPDSPVNAKFLNEEDRLVAIERLRANQQGVESDRWDWKQFREAMFDFKTWMWGFMLFSISIPSGGISTFGPLIIKSFGYDAFSTILFNIPFGAVQIVATLGGAFVATKLKLKAPVLMMLGIPPIIGCVMLLVLPRGPTHRGPLLAGYYLISVYPGITPLIYSWQAGNTAGETKKKTTTGFMIICQSVGNVVGPTLYTTAEAPGYKRGLSSNLALFIALMVLYSIQVVYLFFLNKRHASKRVALGKSAKVLDRSMQQVKHAYDADGKVNGMVEGEDIAVNHEEHAFEDRTDLSNEDFVYVY